MNKLIYNWRDFRNSVAGGAELFTHEIGRKSVEREIRDYSIHLGICRMQER